MRISFKYVPPINDNNYSEDIYVRCMDMARLNPGHAATVWIHLQDAVQRGTISKMEAYDALALGYLPEVLSVRTSAYMHLL